MYCAKLKWMPVGLGTVVMVATLIVNLGGIGRHSTAEAAANSGPRPAEVVEEAGMGTPHQPISATIVRTATLNEEMIGLTTAINILNPEMIKKLEAFFPNYDKSPSSKNPPLGWVRGYEVYLDFGSGKAITICV